MAHLEKEEIEMILWMKGQGVKSFKIDDVGLELEFWAPPAPPAVDVKAILAAPVTEDELYGYQAPEYLSDPDDPDQVKK